MDWRAAPRGQGARPEMLTRALRANLTDQNWRTASLWRVPK